MRFSISTVLLSASLASVASAASCSISGTVYTLEASGVSDIPGICGGLWDNLKRYWWCAVAGPTHSCGGSNGNLKWVFEAPDCVDDSVNAAWWHATKNKFGSVQCKA